MGLPELMELRREQMYLFTKDTGNVNIYDELSIDINDLSTEFIALPGQMAFWTMITAKYTSIVSKLESEYDAWYATVYDEAFKELEQSTGRKPNISSADYVVKKVYKTVWEEKSATLSQAKTDLSILSSIVPALNAKLQCLMQLAKGRNTEMGNLEPVYRQPARTSTSAKTGTMPTIAETKGLFKQFKK